jgi:hypothetical protein
MVRAIVSVKSVTGIYEQKLKLPQNNVLFTIDKSPTRNRVISWSINCSM